MFGKNRYYDYEVLSFKRKGKSGGSMNVSTFPLFLILDKEGKGKIIRGYYERKYLSSFSPIIINNYIY